MTEKQLYWILETKHSAYAFGINDAGILENNYWGKRLDNHVDKLNESILSQPTKKSLSGFFKICGPGWTRTNDQAIMSRLL